MKKTRTRTNDRGFTTVELTVTLAIVGVVAGGSYNAANRVIPLIRAKQAVSDMTNASRSASMPSGS